MMRAVSAGNMNLTLRVATLPTFATLWLIPRLPGFFQKHPDIEISISTRLEAFDLTVENFDLAIHFGQENWPNAHLRKFFSERMIPVASPAFLQQQRIQTIEDADDAPLLHTSSRPSAWHDYLEQVGFPSRPHLTGRYFDQFTMVIAAAQASLGIGLLPRYLIEKEIHEGSLVVIDDFKLVTVNSYYVVTPIGLEDDNVKKFYNWIIKEASAADS